jgi:hypothetical protein
MPTEWFYFADGEGVFYCTRSKVWKLIDDYAWNEVRASFEQLFRFRSDLRDVTPDEKKRLPAPPKEDV